MSQGLNRVTLFGNLGADPEFKMTPNGQALLRLRLATTEGYLDRNRVRQERTEWHSITLWGKRAEALNRILSKGSRVLIEGAIRTSSYEDRDGQKRYRTEIVATNLVLAGGGQRRSSSSSSHDRGDFDDSGDSGEFAGDLPPGDDDIPF